MTHHALTSSGILLGALLLCSCGSDSPGANSTATAGGRSGIGGSTNAEGTSGAATATGGVAGASTLVAVGGTPSVTVDMDAGLEPEPVVPVTPTGDGGSQRLSPEDVVAATTAPCVSSRSEAIPQGSKLMLVVDNSTSMDDLAPGSRTATKWDATRDALLEAVVGVEGSGLRPEMAVGLLLYPNMDRPESTSTPQDTSMCVNTAAMVPIQLLGTTTPEAPQRALIRATLEAPRQGSGTPTHDAYGYGFKAGLALGGASLPGDSYMLLITDGQPSLLLGCTTDDGDEGTVMGEVDPAPIVEAVAAAYGMGVKTFVIGSPGSEAAQEWLSEAAEAGGTAAPGCDTAAGVWCHLDMTSAPDFSAALASGLSLVAAQTATCTYDIPPPPDDKTIVDMTKLQVMVTDTDTNETTLILPDSNGDCTVGWQVSADSKQVVLCPESCSQVQGMATVKVDLVFGCTEQEITDVIPE